MRNRLVAFDSVKFRLVVLVVYSIVIIIASCWPHYSKHYQTGETASGIIPKEGDNFKAVNLPTVYRLENGKKRQYLSDTSYFNFPENTSYDTPYENGGILICAESIVQNIPHGDYMPFFPDGVAKEFKEKRFWEEFRKAFFRRDKVSHTIAYAVWAFLCVTWLLAWEKTVRWPYLFISMLLVGMLLGLTVEWLQGSFIPGRDSEWLDFAFNTFGLTIGGGLAKKWMR